MVKSGQQQSRAPVAERVAYELRRRIADGAYPPHSYLPSVRKLADELQTSRSTIAAAFEILDNQGLVATMQGKGAQVLQPTSLLRSDLIAVVHNLYGQNTSKAEGIRIMAGIEDELTSRGYRYELRAISRLAASVDDLVHEYGAFIMLEATAGHDRIAELESRRIPLVVANLEWPDLDVSATWVDHAKIMRKAVTFLADLGHRHIAYLGLEPSWYFYAQSHRGYLEGMAAADLPVDTASIALFAPGTRPLDGYLATRRMLQSAHRPTAIVAARDGYAQGACQAIEEADLCVGRDVSVVGFDDVTWPHEEKYLTTFREPCHEMGAVAVQMLVDRIVHGWQPPQKTEVEAPFILRRSAGPMLTPHRS